MMMSTTMHLSKQIGGVVGRQSVSFPPQQAVTLMTTTHRNVSTYLCRTLTMTSLWKVNIFSATVIGLTFPLLQPFTRRLRPRQGGVVLARPKSRALRNTSRSLSSSGLARDRPVAGSSRHPAVRSGVTDDALVPGMSNIHIEDDMPHDTFDDDPNVWFWSKNSRALAKEYADVNLRACNLRFNLQDMMTSLPEKVRLAGDMQLSVFRSMIKEGTHSDEPHAPDINIINEIDDEPTPPFEFHYTNQLYHGQGVPKPDLDNLTYCNCIGGCNPESNKCPCVRRQREALKTALDFDSGCAYDENGRIQHAYHDFPIFECNALCRCDDEFCRNRVSCSLRLSCFVLSRFKMILHSLNRLSRRAGR
jgi:hypothetical protein